MRNKWALIPALAAALLTAPAHAQVTQDQASALEAQITAWLQSIAGPDMPLPKRPVQITPEGDHFAVRIPMAELGLKQLDPPDATIIAKAKPLGGTRYAITDQQFPSPLSFTAMQPAPPAAGSKTPPQPQVVTYCLTLGQQDQTATIDTAFATPTTSSGSIASMDIESTDSAGAHATHLGTITSQTSATPTDPAHIDILVDATGQGFFSKTEQPDGNGATISADRLHVAEALTGLTHDHVLPVFRNLVALSNLPKTGSQSMTPAQRDALRAVLVSAKDLMTGGKLDESLDGLKFGIAGQAGSVQHVALSFIANAPAKTLTASLGMVLDGLVLDGMPPNFAALVPTHIAFRPTVSNLDLAALTAAAMQQPPAAKPGAPPPPDPMAALFTTGGVQFGFDQLAVDVAGAQISGSGQFVAKSRNTLSGEADITAHGLDELITRAQTDPMLQQALPVVIFLKGIAKVNGDQSLWQVTLANGHALVNGVDMSAMMGTPPKHP